MYPFFRMAKELWKFRNAPQLDLGDVHISHHRCWPQDLDFWWELNNGRTLTLMDLGRVPAANRTPMFKVMKNKGLGLTVAGNTLRYRRRVRLFDRIELRTRFLGWDERFMYIEQSMWHRNGECANNALYRSAFVGPKGIVAPSTVFEAMGYGDVSPPLSDWVKAWIEAENQRPWPPLT